MAGKFIISKGKGGKYRFSLKATNGQVIAVSELYGALAGCKNGVESVRRNAGAKIEDQTVAGFEVLTNPKYEIYSDKAGEFRFRLRAANGEIIATGEGYKAKASCRNGIDSIGRNAPEAALIVEE